MHGLLLAAGAGSRMGMPKALVLDESGEPWLARAVDVLRSGGCTKVTVVLGASADEARLLVPEGTGIVVAQDWAAGMSASLLAGLAALAMTDAKAVLVHLVDLPDVTAEVVRRLGMEGDRPDALARATYEGRLGHPVLLGRDHWRGIVSEAKGDDGARRYLASHPAMPVECGDLATGRDIDRRPSADAPSSPPERWPIQQ